MKERRALFASCLDARQRRDLVDHVVEGVVGVHPLDGEGRVGYLAEPQRRAHRERQRREALLGLVQAREVGGADAGGGLGGREALELGADQERLADLGGRDRADAHAAVGHRRDEAERLQSLERLAHRGAADAESLAHVLLAQHLPRRDLARDDLVLQRAGDVVSLG